MLLVLGFFTVFLHAAVGSFGGVVLTAVQQVPSFVPEIASLVIQGGTSHG